MLLIVVGYWYINAEKKSQPTFDHKYNVYVIVPNYNKSSQAQDVILKITTEDGMPAVGINVTYRQVEHDFMFSLGPAEYTFHDEGKQLVKQLGVNTASWAEHCADWFAAIYAEPPPYNFTAILSEHLQHITFLKNNFDIKYIVFGIGLPDLRAIEVDRLPTWVNLSDIEGFVKPQWKKYAELMVSNDLADLYLIPGAPLAWIDSPLEDMEQNWELLKWELEVIKNADPGARCGVSSRTLSFVS